MFFKDILAISHDAGLSTKGHTVERVRWPREITTATTNEAARSEISRNQITGIIVRVSNGGIRKEGSQLSKITFVDEFGLVKDHPSNNIILALSSRFAHLKDLFVLHVLILDAVNFNLDAGFGFKLGDKGLGFLKVGERRPTHNNCRPSVGRVRVEFISCGFCSTFCFCLFSFSCFFSFGNFLGFSGLRNISRLGFTFCCRACFAATTGSNEQHKGCQNSQNQPEFSIFMHVYSS